MQEEGIQKREVIELDMEENLRNLKYIAEVLVIKILNIVLNSKKHGIC